MNKFAKSEQKLQKEKKVHCSLKSDLAICKSAKKYHVSFSVTLAMHHRPAISCAPAVLTVFNILQARLFILHRSPYVPSFTTLLFNSLCRFCYPSVKNDNAYFTKTCPEGRLRPTKTSPARPKEVEREKEKKPLDSLPPPPVPLQHSQPKSHRSSPAPPAEAACSCQSSGSGTAPLIKKVNNEYGRRGTRQSKRAIATRQKTLTEAAASSIFP